MFVTLRADTGTPFANGTSATAQVPGTVISDTEIHATSPVTNASGGMRWSWWRSTPRPRTANSTTPLAVYAGLSVFDISVLAPPGNVADDADVKPDRRVAVERQEVEPEHLDGCRLIGHDRLLVVDVQGTVVSPLRITGVTPVLALAAQASKAVIG